MLDVSALRLRYETELFERVLPFWERHSPDRAHGGYFNCLDRDGSVYWTSKHVWLQGRQAWMFAKLHNTVEARPAWREMATLGVDFLRQHAVRREDHRVYFQLSREGTPQQLQRKIFSECFYAMALAETARAVDDAAMRREAEEMLERLFVWAYDWSHVGRPSYPGTAPSQTLAVPMILLNLVEEVGGEAGPARYAAEVDRLLATLREHVDVERRLVLETVAPGGAPLDSPEGRLLNPGHAIEAAWFVEHWAARLARPDLSALARDVAAWSHDAGWDAEHGGLFYFLDAEGHSPLQLEWDRKLWWPHCEALYAHLLLALRHGDTEAEARFRATDAYTFLHFPDPEHGEWYGYLDREGRVSQRFKGGPYKGCFHVPRALWLCWNALKKAEAGQPV